MEELIAARDMEGIWKLYKYGDQPFNVDVLKLVFEEFHNERAIRIAVLIAERDPVVMYTTPGVVDTLFALKRGWEVFPHLVFANAEAVFMNDAARLMRLGENWLDVFGFFPLEYNPRLFHFPGLMDCILKRRNVWLFDSIVKWDVRMAVLADPVYHVESSFFNRRSSPLGRERERFRIALIRRCILALVGADGALYRLTRADGDWAVVFSALAFV